ncbi:ubiquitin-like-conjugating enzyme ATG10 isoform X2 [Malus sylvestris]|uniref:ubiquitin-like-conjugating enzyme ATG10 isoform X2 n=1 Tax=Malus sylvestris TaxID=3752 RepID=UPI0021AC48E7|nr:ubiquitin-like-conjugating enzyme ATG10 isoform X2 [Malus sylvestris]
MEVLGWDGALSSRDFHVAARAFANNWKEFNSAFPPWTWVPSPKQPPHLSRLQQQQHGYLSLEKICLLRSIKEDANEENHAWDEEEPESVDKATLVDTSNLQVRYYDFHIVYSDSYRVPVLYFRGYYIDGQPLALEEIEKDLPARSSKVLLESKWTFITQEEHPYLNRPWYKLHPCGTSEWMKLLFLGDNSQAKNGVAVEQYLVSWLSVVGQVGLVFSSAYKCKGNTHYSGNFQRIITLMLLLKWVMGFPSVEVKAYAAFGSGEKAKDPIFGLAMGADSQASTDVFRWFCVESGSADNPSVILIHGFPSQAYSYSKVLPILSKDYHAIAFDWLGLDFQISLNLNMDLTTLRMVIVFGLISYEGRQIKARITLVYVVEFFSRFCRVFSILGVIYKRS